MEKIDKIISAIKKPLIFASKNQFGNLTAVKDMESHISKLANEALTLSLEQQVKVVFQNLLTRFDSVDSLAINRKKERIEESLTILSQIQNDIAEASISSPADVSFSEGKKLSTPIQFIKGVGPKLSELLGKKGIQVV
ncbi:MAG: hypothetical protein JRF49_11995, partial [Deltaproteobacteria bacterium]|nr:hypothetical protein [Deltaproteobacteria bacterium]